MRAPVPLADCGLAAVATVLGDRWAILVLRELFYGVARFDDLRADLAAPRQSLSAALARLVAGGVVERRPYREPGQRVRHEYVLTAAGRDLGVALVALLDWGDRHVRRASSTVTVVAPDGAAVTARLVTAAGVVVDASAATLRLRPRAD